MVGARKFLLAAQLRSTDYKGRVALRSYDHMLT